MSSRSATPACTSRRAERPDLRRRPPATLRVRSARRRGLVSAPVPEQLLNLLKFFLLVLLYLFFLRVLRAVWTEVNVPRPAESGAGPPAPAPAARPRRPARPR